MSDQLLLDAFPGAVWEEPSEHPAQCAWGGCEVTDPLLLTQDGHGLEEGWCFDHYGDDALPGLVNVPTTACAQCGRTTTTATRRGTPLHSQCRRPFATRLTRASSPKGAYARRRT